MDSAHGQAQRQAAAASTWPNVISKDVMDSYIGLQDVANILTFVAPGYIAAKTYYAVHSQERTDFSQLLIASVVLSLPLVGLYSYLWSLAGVDITSISSPKHAPLLVIFSVVAGLIAARIRRVRPIQRAAGILRLPDPDGDFLKVQFSKLAKHDPVFLKLKNGELLAGTPQGGSRVKDGESRQYCFNNIAWFDKKRKQWDARPGSIIIDLGEVEYIETVKPLPKN